MKPSSKKKPKKEAVKEVLKKETPKVFLPLPKPVNSNAMEQLESINSVFGGLGQQALASMGTVAQGKTQHNELKNIIKTK